jgi:sensor domain CHASE-containing protein
LWIGKTKTMKILNRNSLAATIAIAIVIIVVGIMLTLSQSSESDILVKRQAIKDYLKDKVTNMSHTSGIP